MNVKPGNNYNSSGNDRIVFVKWIPEYEVGIKLIDAQHRELVSLANDLYRACVATDNSIGAVFKEAMSKMVEYVRFHFQAENVLLERIGYPDYQAHRKEHETLIKKILEAAKEYDKGNKLVPNHFVRTLKDWVFSHIAVTDQRFAIYVSELKKKGLITDQQLQ
ncbi:MAG: bacteriohemerythrin [Treponema sp.]|jgi:hemerythrin|nr:bacteriohemerythrin [Treponema sp.]